MMGAHCAVKLVPFDLHPATRPPQVGKMGTSLALVYGFALRSHLLLVLRYLQHRTQWHVVRGVYAVGHAKLPHQLLVLPSYRLHYRAHVAVAAHHEEI